jgi:hypothetical protein
MSDLTPSQDQLVGQLRLLITTIGGIATTLGASSVSTEHWINLVLLLVGPIVVVGGIVLSLIANSRKSIMKAASKPVATGVPAPQIVLPKVEADLAQQLPNNVNTTETKKVVPV